MRKVGVIKITPEKGGSERSCQRFVRQEHHKMDRFDRCVDRDYKSINKHKTDYNKEVNIKEN